MHATIFKDVRIAEFLENVMTNRHFVLITYLCSRVSRANTKILLYMLKIADLALRLSYFFIPNTNTNTDTNRVRLLWESFTAEKTRDSRAKFASRIL